MIRCLAVLISGLLLSAPESFAQGLTQDQILQDLLQRPLSARAARWRCNVEKRNQYADGQCEAGSTQAGWMLLDLSERTYARCDARGCDRYSASVSTGGVFTSVQLDGRSMFLKVVNDGSQFVDVATLGVSAIVSVGRCAPT